MQQGRRCSGREVGWPETTERPVNQSQLDSTRAAQLDATQHLQRARERLPSAPSSSITQAFPCMPVHAAEPRIAENRPQGSLNTTTPNLSPARWDPVPLLPPGRLTYQSPSPLTSVVPPQWQRPLTPTSARSKLGSVRPHQMPSNGRHTVSTTADLPTSRPPDLPILRRFCFLPLACLPCPYRTYGAVPRLRTLGWLLSDARRRRSSFLPGARSDMPGRM